MTDQEINIAIAEAVGARFFSEDGGAFWHFVTKDGREFGPPTEDLNAMHEAEKGLREMQTMTYIDRLGEIVSQGMGDGSYGEIWNMLHATARQRAEAFLRTIGKWRD